MSENNIIWNESLSVGIELFDEHHRKLLEIMIKLKKEIESEEGAIRIKDILSELLSYAKYHFKAEERTMKTFHYPEIEDHLEEHKKFLEHIEELINQYSETSKSDIVSLFEFLKEWWMYHILNVDKKYSKHLKMHM